ncbi:hypothetical protein GOQ27_04435 [Clostridium sp. D2Q-11]|uniref:Uncharacterized protein n=1 Tax=Anaeromonas frigoriresistens TaxID=2683708 RepID=A0A942Z5Q8_9FIRM|nr:hypothetical protein [Anaeromonas frigoriresistens]MBS4537696.1 hypothetical protein [Anaeromonas frigoriresistens]
MCNKIDVVLNIENDEKCKEVFAEALAELIIDRINALPSNQRMIVYKGLLEKLKK